MDKRSFLQKYEYAIIAFALVLINFVVKGIFLSNNALAGDEPYSVYHAQMDISSIINLLSEGNNPPFYEILLHFWIKLFGISEIAVRFPSLIFSSITVFYIYKLGVHYLNKRIALYASILFIFSNYHLFFAQEARGYALLGMLSVLSMYFFMAILQGYHAHLKANQNDFKSTILKTLIPLLIINTLLIYTHYFGFFIIIVQVLFLVFSKPFFKKYWKQVLISLGVIGLLYLPNILVVFNRFIESSSTGTWVDTPNGIHSFYDMLRKFSNAPVVTVSCIVLLISALIKFLIYKKNEQKNIFNRLVVFWFAFIFIFMFSISFIVPMFLDRYLMPAAIAFVIVIAIAADYIIKLPTYRYILPIVISVLFIATTKPNISNKRNVKETVEQIKALKDSNTLVLIHPPHFVLNFAYYYNRKVFQDYNEHEIYSTINTFLISDNIYGIDNLEGVDFKKWDKILLLVATSNFSDSKSHIEDKLDRYFSLQHNYRFYEIFTIFEYQRE